MSSRKRVQQQRLARQQAPDIIIDAATQRATATRAQRDAADAKHAAEQRRLREEKRAAADRAAAVARGVTAQVLPAPLPDSPVHPALLRDLVRAVMVDVLSEDDMEALAKKKGDPRRLIPLRLCALYHGMYGESPELLTYVMTPGEAHGTATALLRALEEHDALLYRRYVAYLRMRFTGRGTSVTAVAVELHRSLAAVKRDAVKAEMYLVACVHNQLLAGIHARQQETVSADI